MLRNCRGYVGILDSDDALFDNALETLMGYWNAMTPQEEKNLNQLQDAWQMQRQEN